MLLQQASTEGSKVVAVDSIASSKLVYGNDRSEIAFFNSDSVVTKVRNEAKITSILTFSSDLLMVFYNHENGKSSASVVDASNLQLVPGLTLHEVAGGIALQKRPGYKDKDPVTLLVFTSAAIRFLQFDIAANPKAKVLRTMEFKGIVSACVSPDSKVLLVATSSEYKLVSLQTGTSTSLFPILNELKPLMVVIGNDFLVVQGTSQDDPAMGLFVDRKGEVARNGIVLEWPSYPKEIETSGNFIYALCDGTVICHEIQESDQSAAPPKTIQLSGPSQSIYKLSYPVGFPHKELTKRLGSDNVSLVRSDVAFLLENNCIEFPEPDPIMVQLETDIANGKITQLNPSLIKSPSTTAMSEQERIQYSYLSAFFILHHLSAGKSSNAIIQWRKDSSLDAELVLYIYGYREQPPPGTRPGLLDLAARTRAKLTDSDKDFLRLYLKSEIKKLRRSTQPSDMPKLKELELMYAQLLHKYPLSDNQHTLSRFLLEKDLRSRPAVLNWLKEIGDTEELKSYYSVSGDIDALSQLNIELLRNPKSSQNLVDSVARELAQYALQAIKSNKSALDPWNVALELLNNSRVNNKLGLKLITSSEFENVYDPTAILQILKEQTDSGPQWRKYLKHLVDTKGLLKNDLAALVTADLMECLHNNKGTLKEIQESYAAYEKLPWPKPAYNVWLLSQGTGELAYNTDLLQHQSEFWNLMDGNLDWVHIMPIFEAQLVALKFERAKIYLYLSLHEQSLDLFNEISDYQSILNYTANIEDTQVREDIAKLTLRSILKNDSSDKNRILQEFLGSDISRSLDFDFLFKLVSDSRPFHTVADFTISKMKTKENQQRQAQMLYIIAKANMK